MLLLAQAAFSALRPSPSQPYPVQSASQSAYSSGASALHPALALAAHQHADCLARVVDGGASVELASVALHAVPLAAPVRIAFPAPVVGPPALAGSPTGTVLLALTAPGFLYRVTLPADVGSWHAVLDRDSDDWAAEHAVRTLDGLGAAAVATVAAVDDACVLLGLKSGVLLKLDWEPSSESWSETSLKPSSYLPSLSSLNPFAHSSPTASTPQSLHSLAAYTPPDGGAAAGLALSCDRRLRVWNLLSGACAKTLELPVQGEALATGEGGWLKLLGAAPSAGAAGSSSLAKHGAEAFDDLLAVHLPGHFLVYGLRAASRSAAGVELVPVVACPAPASTSSAAPSLRAFDLLPAPAGARLWTAWDAHGRPAFASVELDVAAGSHGPWQAAEALPEPAYTASFFTDAVLSQPSPSPASIATLFTQHLFFPHRFGLASLSAALEAYASALVGALPPGVGAPAALGASYSSLPDRVQAIVGAHLAPQVDPATGALKEREHLDRVLAEWLGFLARVDEAEREARWCVGSLRLGGGGGGEWAAVRRDGVVLPFSAPAAPAGDALEQLGGRIAQALPPHVLDAVRAELQAHAAGEGAFGALEDALLDLWAARAEEALPADVVEEVQALVEREGGSHLASRITELALEIGSATAGGRATDAVADDDDDAQPSPLGAALLAQSFLATVSSAERRLLSLVLLSTAALAHTDDGAPELVQLAKAGARALAGWREAAAWEAAARDAVDAGLPTVAAAGAAAAGEWVERFGGLKVNGNGGAAGSQAALLPPPSVLAALLRVSAPRLTSVQSALSALLARTSLADPAERTPALVLVQRVLALGQPARARELASRWDESDGVGYVRARAGLALGDVHGSERLFERVTGAFDLPSANSPLKAVLPPKVVSAWSHTEYYRHVSLLFAPQTQDASIVKFCNLAIAAATDAEKASPVGASAGGMEVDDEERENGSGRKEGSTKDLWSRLFAATVSLGRYEDAYMVLISNPHRDTINDAVSHLITHMCHANQVARLVQFSFVGLHDVVERTLAFKARHADPMQEPSYPMVLYSWHVHRGDYRNAALAVYAQARRFGDAHGPFAEVSARRAKAYLLAINALALVDPKHAWLAMPVAVDPSGKRRKRTKTTSYIPEELFSPAARARDVEIVDLDDIRQEYNLVLSTLTLAEKFPNSFHSNILLAEDAVSLFLQAGMVDTAVSTAKKLHVDLEGLVSI